MVEPSAERGVQSSEDAERPDPTDEWVEAARRGDADAFEHLSREHAPRLFRLAVHLTRDREEAEDLVQDTLMKTWKAIPGFEGRARWSTYLVRALTNTWKNRLRSKKRSRIVAWLDRRGDGDSPDPQERPDPSSSALDGIVTRERNERIRGALERLEPTRRLTLLLREVEDMTYEEIAEVTDVAVGTVRSRLARARRDLRVLLEAER